ncbi:MAG: hypothetical protein D6799_05495 [Bacteroidetes bacterium]|nr:MAG: hypothetical protein D6799_05495 [Bacteroidota bacterium]
MFVSYLSGQTLSSEQVVGNTNKNPQTSIPIKEDTLKTDSSHKNIRKNTISIDIPFLTYLPKLAINYERYLFGKKRVWTADVGYRVFLLPGFSGNLNFYYKKENNISLYASIGTILTDASNFIAFSKVEAVFLTYTPIGIRYQKKSFMVDVYATFVQPKESDIFESDVVVAATTNSLWIMRMRWGEGGGGVTLSDQLPDEGGLRPRFKTNKPSFLPLLLFTGIRLGFSF